MNSSPRRSITQLTGNIFAPKKAQEKTIWGKLCPRIKEGSVIPIIGHSVHGNRIFQPRLAQLAAKLKQGEIESVPLLESIVKLVDGGAGVDEVVAAMWAQAIDYPFGEERSLARIAQFNYVISSDEVEAQRSYRDFLKNAVLSLVELVEPNSGELIQDLRAQINERSFSDIVTDLALPDGIEDENSALRVLARLNLPIYVTTSYYDFMERAIKLEGRPNVRTQICADRVDFRDEHKIKRDFVPSIDEPVVYHLHGFEQYPGSLVLSEDDYLRFLMRVSKPVDQEKPVIPLYLSEKLAESTLLLLGFRMQDWDFRTIFRGLITAKETPRLSFGLALQFAPLNERDKASAIPIQNFLKDYFLKLANFQVEWRETDCFVLELWDQWNRWRNGET